MNTNYDIRYSVVIPVYNAEKTLEPCLDSILLLQRRDTEIILVDDGSVDNSGAICDRYAGEHQTVRVIHQPNQGVSAARNQGIKAANGKYLLFVDSDDRVTDSFFEVVDRAVEQKDADYMMFASCIERSGESIQNHVAPFWSDDPDAVFEKIGDLICRRAINSPCAKTFKKKILESGVILFPEGFSIAEDWTFNILYALRCKSCLIVDEPIYIINRDNANSLSRSKRDSEKEQQILTLGSVVRKEIEDSELTQGQKDSLFQALNFDAARSIYSKAKAFHVEGYGWLKRNQLILKLCAELNRRHLSYPKTRFCRLATLPVKFYLSAAIDYLSGRRLR